MLNIPGFDWKCVVCAKNLIYEQVLLKKGCCNKIMCWTHKIFEQPKCTCPEHQQLPFKSLKNLSDQAKHERVTEYFKRHVVPPQAGMPLRYFEARNKELFEMSREDWKKEINCTFFRETWDGLRTFNWREFIDVLEE